MFFTKKKLQFKRPASALEGLSFDTSLGRTDASSTLDILNQESIFKLQGFCQEHMKALYSLAYTQYSGSRYEDAEKIFVLLCLLEHRQKRNWMGLGASRQMNKNYAGAAYAYMQASHMDQTAPTIWVHLAECLLQLQQKSEAEAALQQAEKRCGAAPEYLKCRHRIEFLKTHFLRKSSAKSHKNLYN